MYPSVVPVHCLFSFLVILVWTGPWVQWCLAVIVWLLPPTTSLYHWSFSLRSLFCRCYHVSLLVIFSFHFFIVHLSLLAGVKEKQLPPAFLLSLRHPAHRDTFCSCVFCWNFVILCNTFISCYVLIPLTSPMHITAQIGGTFFFSVAHSNLSIRYLCLEDTA